MYDDPNRYPSGKIIEDIFDKHRTKIVQFQHKVYRSWHVDLIGYSVLDAFQYVFSDYQDYSLFEKGVKSKSFGYKKTKEQYVKQNEKYIKPYLESEESSTVVGEIIRRTKSPKLLWQYLDYEDPNREMYNLYARAFLFYEINDLETALAYLDKMVSTNDPVLVRQLVNSNGEFYLEVYRKANNMSLAQNYLEYFAREKPGRKR